MQTIAEILAWLSFSAFIITALVFFTDDVYIDEEDDDDDDYHGGTLTFI